MLRQFGMIFILNDNYIIYEDFNNKKKKKLEFDMY